MGPEGGVSLTSLGQGGLSLAGGPQHLWPQFSTHMLMLEGVSSEVQGLGRPQLLPAVSTLKG